MNILAIGNSFSEDATYYLKKIADAAGTDLRIVNLYVPGCSFEMHRKNLEAEAAAYRYEENGLYTDRMAGIVEVLKEEKWDAVTVQQTSGWSGHHETYEPDGGFLVDVVRKYAPGAEIFVHRTWAYSRGSDHFAFPRYHNDQREMYGRICAATTKFAADHGLSILPVGDVLQYLREGGRFDDVPGDFCRDGFHLSLVYGRFAAAMTWYKRLAGGKLPVVTLTEADIVNGFTEPDFSFEESRAAIIREAVEAVCGK